MQTAGRRDTGFTLIELLIVVAIIGLLVGVAMPTYQHAQTKAREAVLKQNLFILRQTIDQYFADKGYYPATLQALVDEKYLRRMPVDPITKESTWDEEQAETGASVDPTQPPGVWDVKSRAEGSAEDGTPYSSL
jgi:general secretion pathway protein G